MLRDMHVFVTFFGCNILNRCPNSKMRRSETQNPDYFETNGCVSFFLICLTFSREMRQMRHEKAIFRVSQNERDKTLYSQHYLIVNQPPRASFCELLVDPP